MSKKQDFKNTSKADRDKKMKELKLELVKAKVSGSKAGTAKVSCYGISSRNSSFPSFHLTLIVQCVINFLAMIKLFYYI